MFLFLGAILLFERVFCRDAAKGLRFLLGCVRFSALPSQNPRPYCLTSESAAQRLKLLKGGHTYKDE